MFRDRIVQSVDRQTFVFARHMLTRFEVWPTAHRKTINTE